MPAPTSGQIRLARQLWPGGEAAQGEFLAALTSPAHDGHALLWLGKRPVPHPFATVAPEAWQAEFIDRLAPEVRGAGRHELHEAGAFYSLDFSSVFAATVLTGIATPPRAIVDLCASPGGKALFAWRLFRPEFLVANEVIGKRLGALISNFERCGVGPAHITSLDPAVIARHAAGAADLVIVDAPCSGQSLVAKGGAAPGAFHPATVNLCANRQRRILAHAAQVVRPGGHLAYLTCTYAEKENEGNARWFLKHQPEFAAVAVPALAGFRSERADFSCYRLWPQQGLGAGAFAVLLRRAGEGPAGGRLEDLHRVWPRRAD